MFLKFLLTYSGDLVVQNKMIPIWLGKNIDEIKVTKVYFLGILNFKTPCL